MNTVTTSFNTTVRQMTTMPQLPKCLSKKKTVVPLIPRVSLYRSNLGFYISFCETSLPQRKSELLWRRSIEKHLKSLGLVLGIACLLDITLVFSFVVAKCTLMWAGKEPLYTYGSCAQQLTQLVPVLNYSLCVNCGCQAVSFCHA